MTEKKTETKPARESSSQKQPTNSKTTPTPRMVFFGDSMPEDLAKILKKQNRR